MSEKTDRKAGNRAAERLDEEVTATNAPTSVLLAEDDDEMRAMLADALRHEGYVVTEAHDGDELLAGVRTSVLQAADGTAVDLVISDVRMPGRPTLEVLRTLREADWAVPVILITAFGDAETRETARRLGAAMVLDKPFEIDDLCAAAAFLAAPL